MVRCALSFAPLAGSPEALKSLESLDNARYQQDPFFKRPMQERENGGGGVPQGARKTAKHEPQSVPTPEKESKQGICSSSS